MGVKKNRFLKWPKSDEFLGTPPKKNRGGESFVAFFHDLSLFCKKIVASLKNKTATLVNTVVN